MAKKVVIPKHASKAFAALEKNKRREPLWKGPEVDGVTQSMLNRFFACPERFRIHVIEGLQPRPQFNHRMEYGHLWHTCEEYHAKGEDWETPLFNYAKALAKKYPDSQPEIDKWYNVCKIQFPMYLLHWKRHAHVKGRKPVLEEEVVNVPFKLPSGRIVRIKGKLDSADNVTEAKKIENWLQENKTKGDYYLPKLMRQLKMDNQSMFYLTILDTYRKQPDAPKLLKDYPIVGVRYNVIRRPLSGGRGSIVQKKGTKNNPAGESSKDYYKRLEATMKEIMDEDEHHFFTRITARISPKELVNYQQRVLIPTLERLCKWYDMMKAAMTRGVLPFELANNYLHWQHPFGMRNILDEGGESDLDPYLENGNEVGLVRVEELFPELKP